MLPNMRRVQLLSVACPVICTIDKGRGIVRGRIFLPVAMESVQSCGVVKPTEPVVFGQ
jgi:hypothetical protein